MKFVRRSLLVLLAAPLCEAFIPAFRLGSDRTFAQSSQLHQIPILDNWKVLNNGALVGTVRDHPSIDDGDVIATSPLENPESAYPRSTVTTKSGSKYRLGNPLIEEAQQRNGIPEKKGFYMPTLKLVRPQGNIFEAFGIGTSNNNQRIDDAKVRQARLEYELTGEAVGRGKYLLAGKAQQSTSGKSKIYTCYQNDGNGIPTGEPLIVKISPNIEALKREEQNYRRVTTGLNSGQFVHFLDYIPQAGEEKPFNVQSAIVMERGDLDLKAHLSALGPLTGRDLQDAARAAVDCLRAVHSAKLVWTDLKAENFVVKMDGGKLVVKGIDLESAIPYMENPVDYSPEACPPEFARAFLEGDGPFFVLDYSYDIWSLGMTLFEMATGYGMFDGYTPLQITQTIGSDEWEVDTRAVEDPLLRDVIQQCLRKDPASRPSIGQLFFHPFFLSSALPFRLF